MSLLADATKAGLSPLEFWDMTLREVDVWLRGVAWRAEQEQQRTLALAWHIAALGRQKRLQSLRSLLRPRSKARSIPISERRKEFAELKATYVDHRARRSTSTDPGDTG